MKTNSIGASEKGISLLFVVLIMTIILAISLGISAIFFQQTIILTDLTYSVASFYAADSGVERELYDLYKLAVHQSNYTDTVGGATYSVTTVCSTSNTNCFPGFSVDPNCIAQNFCIKSSGVFEKTTRAVEVDY